MVVEGDDYVEVVLGVPGFMFEMRYEMTNTILLSLTLKAMFWLTVRPLGITFLLLHLLRNLICSKMFPLFP